MAYLLKGCTGQIYLLTVDYVINLPDEDLKGMKFFQLGHILFKLKDHGKYLFQIKLYPLKLFDILSNEI